MDYFTTAQLVEELLMRCRHTNGLSFVNNDKLRDLYNLIDVQLSANWEKGKG